jgi:hypothetical protein
MRLALLVLVVGLFNGKAMTPEEFARFLAAPPEHGYARITRITPIHEPERGMTNRLCTECEFSWSSTNFFSAVREPGLKRNAGMYEGREWDYQQEFYTEYVGTNRNDELRRNSMFTSGFSYLQALGIYYYVKGTASLKDGNLDAEVEIPGARERLGVVPRLRGKFTTLPNGTVSQLDYSVYVPGRESKDTLDYMIQYKFTGSWGPGFPSYIAVYLIEKSGPGSGVPKLFYETEISEWNVGRVPNDKEINPALIFTNIDQHVLLSNDVAFEFQKGPRDNRGTMVPIIADSKERKAAVKRTETRKRYVRRVIFLVALLPVTILAGLAIRKSSQRNI